MQTKENYYNGGISLIRFISTIMIVSCHFLQYFNLELAWWLNVGVQIFFIMSGFLYGNKGKTRRASIDASIRSKTLEVRDSIIHNLKKADIPPSSAEENKCGQCEFFNFCADRF